MATERRSASATSRASSAERPSRVLVPLDLSEQSERALVPAFSLASRLGCPITLFGWHWDDGAAAALRRRLTALALELDGSTRVDVAQTNDWSVARPLLHAVRRERGTLICMASHARTGVGATLLGSVAEEVVREGAEPVLLVGPRFQPELASLTGPVVACVDGSGASQQAIPMAAAWATALDVPLEVVRMLEPVCDTEGARRDEEDGATAWEALQGGDAADAIVAYAHGRASLLALATHGRRRLARMVMGSVAVQVVRHAPCPVLLVRPRDLP